MTVIHKIEKGNEDVDFCLEFINNMQKELDREPKSKQKDEEYYKEKCIQIRTIFDFIS